MAELYEKINDSTLKVTYEKAETFNYDLLLKKKAFYEAELAKVNKLVAEAVKLGLLTKDQLIQLEIK
jgi:hypothetical protein